MQIVIARHGETDWNLNGRMMGQKDIPLNEHGREQARILKEKLSNFAFDCCYTSPLIRAKETAEIICDGKCNVISDNNLKERYGGTMEGQVIQNWKDFKDDGTAESSDGILNRAKSFLETIKQTDHNCILIVSHNGLIKNLRHLILEKDGEVDYKNGGLSNCDFESYEI
jgi:broad specificity phosphatase PhoE